MLKKILSSQPKTSRIAVVQYPRPVAGFFDTQDPKHVSRFHLALVVIEENKLGEVWRILWQADNQPVPATSHSAARVEWLLDIREPVSVGNLKRCLGGVYIGEVKKDELNELKQAIETTAVLEEGKLRLKQSEEVTGWNCRSWITEVIRNVLAPRGWAYAGINTVESLLSMLCEAAKNSQDNAPVFVEYK